MGKSKKKSLLLCDAQFDGPLLSPRAPLLEIAVLDLFIETLLY
jgi:hypothetical protein